MAKARSSPTSEFKDCAPQLRLIAYCGNVLFSACPWFKATHPPPSNNSTSVFS